ncbi:unnamed protein product [Prunus brigantina]
MPNLTNQQYKQICSVLKEKESDSQPDSQANIASSGLFKNCSTTLNWIIDSGATDHITSSPHLLTNVKHSTMPPVKLPSGDQAPITATGTLPINSYSFLKDVLGVPTFKVDLMSVSKITEDLTCSVTFFPQWCVLQDLATRRTIGLGKQRGGLYYLAALASPNSSPNKSDPSCHLASASADLWHRRLGHLSSARLNFMSKTLLNFPCSSNNICDICPLAKQTRLPFSNSSITSSHPFALIHCDIWGPHKIASLSGAHYFLTVVDDFTRFTWIFLMHTKSETQEHLRSFFAYTQTQFNTKIKQIRVDNGGEFYSLRNFFKDHGVIYQRSCVYTPQQNGVVERKHRHLIEMARALLFQAHLPLRFWGEGVLTAAHIINRIPTKLLSHQTPFEKLYSKPPSYKHMRVFGCLAFATNNHPTSKFDIRAKKSIFLGYPSGQKAYKLYDFSTHKNFINRDVNFFEHHFPFHTLNPTTPSDQLHVLPTPHLANLDPCHSTLGPHNFPPTNPTFSPEHNFTLSSQDDPITPTTPNPPSHQSSFSPTDPSISTADPTTSSPVALSHPKQPASLPLSTPPLSPNPPVRVSQRSKQAPAW